MSHVRLEFVISTQARKRPTLAHSLASISTRTRISIQTHTHIHAHTTHTVPDDTPHTQWHTHILTSHRTKQATIKKEDEKNIRALKMEEAAARKDEQRHIASVREQEHHMANLLSKQIKVRVFMYVCVIRMYVSYV
jgi:hypothetical protein